MAHSLVYRALTPDDMPQMYRSFLEAFSDYRVNMKMSREAFEDRVLSKLNIGFDVSPGVFSGDKLVAFIFQTLNQYEGRLAAYNGGTGVIPGHTGQGLTKKMYDFIEPELKKRRVEKCVLEVLTDNKVAIKAYEKAGFEKSKHFQCMMRKIEEVSPGPAKAHPIRKARGFSIEELQSVGEINPSMLDQLSQLEHHLKKETILECRHENDLLAYIIFQPGNGRISQIAVKANHRGQGLGRALVSRALEICQSKTMSVLNIETHHEGLIGFFTRMGFIKDLVQYEMQKSLKDG